MPFSFNRGVKRVSQETSLVTLLLASFSYFGVFILLPLIFKNKHPFVRFHLKRGAATLVLLVASVVLAKFWLVVGISLHVATWTIIIFAMIKASRGYY